MILIPEIEDEVPRPSRVLEVADNLDVATLLSPRVTGRDAEVCSHLMTGRTEERKSDLRTFIRTEEPLAPSEKTYRARERRHPHPTVRATTSRTRGADRLRAGDGAHTADERICRCNPGIAASPAHTRSGRAEGDTINSTRMPRRRARRAAGPGRRVLFSYETFFLTSKWNLFSTISRPFEES